LDDRVASLFFLTASRLERGRELMDLREISGAAQLTVVKLSDELGDAGRQSFCALTFC